MRPPVLERLGFKSPRATAETWKDRGLMARSLMYLFTASGTVTLVSLAFMDGTAVDEPRILVTVVSAYAIAAVLLLGYDALPVWFFHLALASGTMLIEWAIYASNESTSAYAMLYFWIAIYAVYFFDRAQAAFQLFVIGVAYAAVLSFISDPTSAPVVRWAITTSALVVAGAMIGLLKERVDLLIAQLAETARRDPLTGLLNRRGFTETVTAEFDRTERTGGSVGLILGDLDSFKAINDRFGHSAGDEALRALGVLFGELTRGMDAVARLGGEEFAFLAPEADEQGALVVAERLRLGVRDRFADGPHPLTISFGVATFPAHGTSLEELLGAADRALYRAKELGRDRTVSTTRRDGEYRKSHTLVQAPAAGVSTT